MISTVRSNNASNKPQSSKLTICSLGILVVCLLAFQLMALLPAAHQQYFSSSNVLFNSGISVPPSPDNTDTDTSTYRQALDKVAGNSTSLRLLLETLLQIRGSKLKEAPPRIANVIDDDEEVIVEREAARCKRYRFRYDQERTVRRRIFAGGMLADDSFHVLGLHALETFNVYHHYAFVESNRTHIYIPRTMRFLPGSSNRLVLQKLFGPKTTVTVDTYMVNSTGNLTDELENDTLLGQQLHRNEAIKRWKQAGMRPGDIGIIMDVDEVMSRDFLRALQICDLPEFRLGEQTCRSPKIHGRGLHVLGSFRCIRHARDTATYTPTAILGECIEGIGDRDKHGLAKRTHRPAGAQSDNDTIGYREGGNDNWPKLYPKNTRYFPLWNGVDFRRTAGGRMGAGTTVTGFHVNNFVTSTEDLRWKFVTYGDTGAQYSFKKTGRPYQGPLIDIPLHEAATLMVACVTNETVGNRTRHPRIDPKWLHPRIDHKNLTEWMISQEFPVPQVFRLQGYVEARHEEVDRLVRQDMAKYG